MLDGPVAMYMRWVCEWVPALACEREQQATPSGCTHSSPPPLSLPKAERWKRRAGRPSRLRVSAGAFASLTMPSAASGGRTCSPARGRISHAAGCAARVPAKCVRLLACPPLADAPAWHPWLPWLPWPSCRPGLTLLLHPDLSFCPACWDNTPRMYSLRKKSSPCPAEANCPAFSVTRNGRKRPETPAKMATSVIAQVRAASPAAVVPLAAAHLDSLEPPHAQSHAEAAPFPRCLLLGAFSSAPSPRLLLLGFFSSAPSPRRLFLAPLTSSLLILLLPPRLIPPTVLPLYNFLSWSRPARCSRTLPRPF